MPQAEKTLSWILKGGLLLTPFLVFIVARSLYFPFITGKNFAFRILVELLAVIWVYAALKFPGFRPRSSALAWAVIVFIAVMGIATAFSLSPYRSFWSNFERMEGYVALLHLLLYFLLLGAVFKTRRDWGIFFHTSIAASVIASFYALLQLAGRFEIHQGGTRVDATLGNATYFAAYLLFHLFFLLWFFLRPVGSAERSPAGLRSQNLYAHLGYGAIFFLEAAMLYFTATRGAVIGLLGGFLLLGVLLAVVERGLIRRWALAGLGAVILIPIAFFLVKDAPFVKNSDVLSRFAAISPRETTTQARFTIWSMALKGWRERPILGWGQESFVYVFSKYYDPSLWRQEPWFDRAHNVFLDWLISGGVLGLAGYLGIFAAAGWLLLRSLRAGALDGISFSAISALLAAHFFQIIFVFDNLTSWLLFFAVLAYLHSVSSRRLAAAGPGAPSPPALLLPSGVPLALTVVAGAAFVLVFYFANLKPLLAAKAVLDALKTTQTHEPAGKVDAIMAAFQKGIELNTFGTTELREQISQTVPNITRDAALAEQDKIKFLRYAVEELEKQRRDFPSDMRAKAFLATIYTSAGRQDEAIQIVNEALAVSDRRQQFYFVAAEAYLNAGQRSKAIEVLKRAYELSPDYPEAIANLAVVMILDGRDEEAELFLESRYGRRVVAEERYAQAYAQVGKLKKAAIIWEELVKSSPQSAKYHANLGAVYFQLGQAELAVSEIEEAMRLEPGFRPQGEQIIKEIRSGQLR